MVKKELIDYIRTYANKGYPVSYIRNYLINYGYSANEVDSALRYIESPSRTQMNLGPMLKFIIPAVIILAVVAFLIPTVMLRTPSSANNQEIIVAKPTNVIVPEQPSAVTSPATPETNYSNVPTTECPASCDDGKECTRDYCSENTGFMCVHQPVRPCCGNGDCESGENENNCARDCTLTSLSLWDQIVVIKQKAETDPSGAMRECSAIDAINFRNRCYADVAVVAGNEAYCDDIKDSNDAESLRFSCYSNVAKVVSKNEICDKITDDVKRDECYMNFVLAEDYSVCDKITNSYQKQNCLQLKQIKEMIDSQPVEEPLS